MLRDLHPHTYLGPITEVSMWMFIVDETRIA